MIVEYLRYAIDKDRQGDFIRAYDAAREPLGQSPYFLGLDLCQCVEDPSQFILRIEWTSAEDHLQGFRKSAEFRDFFNHIRPYVGAIAEMRHYNRILPPAV
jgi:heme-degrading monooxygenase HmoA